jgi:uncharacterized spore protein YtfJ
MEQQALMVQNVFRDVKDALLANANVKAVFGEPIQAGDKTIIPVARVAYGFGAGSGTGRGGRSGDGPGIGGEGGGGGGGVAAMPVGVVEVGPVGTRFVRVSGTRRLVGAASVGLMLGMFVGWLRHRQ